MLQFDLPKDQSSIIKVIGVGGGGSNAVNHMYSQNIDGVDFIICNTDAQAINQSKVPNKIQLGPHLTQGLGAGANPLIGRQACEESLEEIKRILEVNTKMAFITAGMGGGTGTGGAPILAGICKQLGILTVGIVTTPFAYEGKKRISQAEEGIALLKEHVDTLLVISNDKLRHQFGNLKMKEAFAKADNVLATAAKCITDVINSTGQINVDFADVCTVMRNGGVAILGSAMAEGENRAQTAIENALNSPLLNDNDIKGAKWILININSCEGDHEFTMDEVEVIQNYLLAHAGEETDVILGLGYDNTLGAGIGITLIATGFEHKDPFEKKPSAPEKKEDKVMMKLEMPQPAAPVQMAKPLFQLDTTEEDKSAIAEITEAPALPEIVEDSMQPRLVEMEAKKEEKSMFFFDENPAALSPEKQQEAPVEAKPAVSSEPVFFEISSASDHVPTFEFDLQQITDETAKKTVVEPQKAIEHKPVQATVTAPSAGYLSKPSNIYKEENNDTTPFISTAPAASAPVEKTEMENNISISQPTQDQPAVKAPQPAFVPSMPEATTDSADEMDFEFKMVIREQPATPGKDNVTEDSKSPVANSGKPEMKPNHESDDLKQREMDRIAKLRNLSFNLNASDPNNEFETIPAYLRRDLNLHNSIADVESFYSNYTVRSDDKNQAEISTINEFLDGNKPD